MQSASGINSAHEDSKPRNDGIDLIRGFSIFAVVMFHFKLMMRFAGHPIIPQMQWLPSGFAYLLFSNGSNAVTVFFAVSGFLITSTSLHRFGSLGDVKPLQFYKFRFARIAPLLLLVTALLSLLHVLNMPRFVIDPKVASLWEAVGAATTFTLNYFEAVRGYLPAGWDVMWSLSVEEVFYLLFPIVCIAVELLPAKRAVILAFLIALILIGPLARTVWTNNEVWTEKSYLGNMDAIAMGCLTALLLNSASNGQRRIAKYVRGATLMKFTGTTLILLVAIWPHWAWLRSLGRAGLDTTILPVGTCLLIAGFMLSHARARRISLPIRWLGRHSYEIYLTHEFVVIAVVSLYARVVAGPIVLWIMATIFCSAAIGAGAAYLFSEPLNGYLRRKLVKQEQRVE